MHTSKGNHCFLTRFKASHHLDIEGRGTRLPPASVHQNCACKFKGRFMSWIRKDIVRCEHVTNAACHRASRTMAACQKHTRCECSMSSRIAHRGSVRSQKCKCSVLSSRNLEKHKWSLWHLKEKKKNPSVDGVIIVAVFIVRILPLRQLLLCNAPFDR